MSAVAITGASRAAADAGDAIAGALVGGIIGHAIAKDQQRRQQRTVVVRRSAPAVSSAQRQINRDMQTALNYFGFSAGAVDGAVGPGTRAAVSRYQAQMGYPASGHIQPHERDYLMSAYSWASTGGAAVTSVRTPQELLVAYRSHLAGMQQPQMAFTQAMPPMAGPQPQVAAQPPAVAAAAPATVLDPEAAEVVTAAAPQVSLPNFMGADAAESLASHCNKVSLLTSTNGGFTTPATMTDAAFALNEQFCLARTYAIAAGEELAGKVEGVTSAEMVEQCRAFAPTMRPHVSALSLRPGADVLADVASFVLETGLSPAQLAGTSRICLSVGYRTDDLEVALGSALLLTALGERVYGELLGHHLAQGFGASQRPDLALAWYQMSAEAIDQGQRAVFAPGQPERQTLITLAAAELNGGDADSTALPSPQPAAVLPTFSVNQ
ncbi:peptidoglycan-binding domain-containing protein [Roseitranquillus sediminis]|uniref:peptidoglycan-binding domain-containing protein n=1 Tax=Roseitranquillus sediminis TaxID=2809051 RepID=UPI001D0CA488|nr:peptidoglycan-binding domain-containing protein [Roseitranquillus sediminis]MBM9594729.1 peptidoglycan-binding protein [Roseitranquillus sediminis]